jgi:hypothetical protein
MAWSDPGDFTSGQILTAAQMDSVREAMFFGQATFTNEAARDAAIPATGIALQEGMRAYLTAPTVPAATGANTFVPTGITTIYNGTSWVCITPVSATTATLGTTSSLTFTPTLSGGGTNVSVTLTTGTRALVMVGAATSNTPAATHNMGVAVSGATTIAAVSTEGTYSDFSGFVRQSDQYVITGLTPGTNTFTAQYITATGTASFAFRHLTVVGIA